MKTVQFALLSPLLSLFLTSPLLAGSKQNYFCESYYACRQQFRDVVLESKLQHPDAVTWSSTLPNWDPLLSMDFAYFPSPNPQKLLIISSAVHGIEGFTGSAIQSLFVQELLRQTLSQDVSVLFMHGINAYGFRARNRYDENHVDLNRNWFASEQFPVTPSNENYDRLHGLFNPREVATFGTVDFNWFVVRRLLPWVRSIANGTLTQAAGQGTYTHADGIIFGGHDYEPHRQVILPLLRQFLPEFEHIMVWDLHTGLGKRQLQLLPNPAPNEQALNLRKKIFEVGDRKLEETGGVEFYTSPGDFSDFVCETATLVGNSPTCVNMLMEFGTLMPPSWEKRPWGSSLKISVQQAYTLYLQIRENQRYHYGVETIEQGRELMKAYDDLFFPKDLSWRTMVMHESRALLPLYVNNFSRL